jgi:hypothetical protein
MQIAGEIRDVNAKLAHVVNCVPIYEGAAITIELRNTDSPVRAGSVWQGATYAANSVYVPIATTGLVPRPRFNNGCRCAPQTGPPPGRMSRAAHYAT